MKQAKDALKLPLIDRLKKYSFIYRYSKCGKNNESNKRKLREEMNNLQEIGNTKISKKAKASKKFQRICTVSSTTNSNDQLSVILEDLNWDDTEIMDLIF